MAELIPFVFIGLFVALVVYGIYAAGKRRKELAAWAAARNLRLDPDDLRGLDRAFPDFECLQRGANRYAYNVINGDWGGRRFNGFDYHYETYSTDSKGRRTTHHHHFSAVILESELPLKPLFMRPEGFFDKIGEFFGFDDIDFESAQFSREYHVKSPDKQWAFDVLHQRTIEFILSLPRFCLQFGPRHVIVYRESIFSVGDFEAAARLAQGILDRLPGYVKQKLSGGSKGAG